MRQHFTKTNRDDEERGGLCWDRWLVERTLEVLAVSLVDELVVLDLVTEVPLGTVGDNSLGLSLEEANRNKEDAMGCGLVSKRSLRDRREWAGRTKKQHEENRA